MTRYSHKQLFSVYNSLRIIAEKNVQQHCPHLNLSNFKLPKDASEEIIVKNMSSLTSFIRDPYYAHIFIAKQK